MRMSVGLGLPVPEDPSGMALADDVAQLAGAAERLGFDGVYVTDHPVPHPSYFAHGGHHTFDPFVLLSFAAANTRTLRLQTHLVVLPYRNPFITAKAAASLDALSGGRLILGVGTGYMQPEFEALGVQFRDRGELTDEAISVIRTTWSGDRVDIKGRQFTARGNQAHPRPAQRPGPPIWVGGNSKRAIRRAVQLGDGWIPFPHRPESDRPPYRHSDSLSSIDDLAVLIAYARDKCEEVQRREPLEIAFMPGFSGFLDRYEPSSQELVDNCGKLAELGVTYLMATVSGRTISERVDALGRYAQDVLPAAGAL
jgi:probable F420-dependent oxidoreductase